MSRKTILQYLEFLKLSGIQDIYINKSLFESGIEQDIEQNIVASITDNIQKNKPVAASSNGSVNNQTNNTDFVKMKPPEQNSSSPNRSKEEKQTVLESLRMKYNDCQSCGLGRTRNNLVYGNGDADSKLMLIGEGPGADEDASGDAFVGRAGQLLTKMLQAINIDRKDVYICNIVKCRPPNNRNPLPEERSACLPHLLEQIEIIQPERLLLLGKVAAETLLGFSQNMTNFRLKIHLFQNIPTYVTYHPSALLRNPSWKKFAWIDLQKLQKDYETIL